MKKKRNVLLLLSLMLICIVALSACSLVSVNEERQANRIMATVTVDLAEKYDGIKNVMGNDWDYTVSLEINRRELISTVNYTLNYMAQLYAQLGSTYDYDVESIMDAGLDNLISQKYRVICAMGELLLKSKETGRYDALYCLTDEYKAIYGNKLVPEGVLTVAERFNAINAVNSQFESQIETLTTETTNEERDNEKSEANVEIGKHYNDGYFVKRVEVAYKDADGTFKDGLYTSVVVKTEKSEQSSSSSSSSTEEKQEVVLDYTKVYVKVTMSASGKEDKVVYTPVEELNLKTEKDENTPTKKYHTAMKATVSYSGRVYAEVTEENDSGYNIESFTSKPVSFEVVEPRSAYSAKAEEETSALDNLRYVKVSAWKDTASFTDEMKEFKKDIFVSQPEKYASNLEKDAYRQLRNTFKSSNIGYEESDPGKESANYINFKYYGGLKYYYDSQFTSEVLSAKKYEVTESVKATDEEVTAEYNALVLKDKANYEGLSHTAQVEKFFTTIASDLSTAYYVPIEALTSVSFEINPADKKYEALFTKDGNGAVTAFNTNYVTEENGKYTMKYAYLNDDGTYTVNMFYVTHILFSLDNVVGLTDDYKNASADHTDEDKLMFVKLFAEKMLKMRPQLADYLAKYEERAEAEEKYEYAIGDVFGDEKAYSDIKTEVGTALSETYANSGNSYVALLNKFIELMEMYNDDGGKLASSGYLVSAGDMKNNWYADFTNTALNIYFTLLNADKPVTGYDQTDNIALENLIQDAYSDYGVHKMIISFAPLYHVTINTDGSLDMDAELTLDGKTWRETVEKSLTDTEKEAVYKDWEKGFTDDEIKNHSEKNEKNYENLKKEIENN